MPDFERDLAAIHEAAFGDLAIAAGGHLVALLRSRGFRAGRIAELGCGGGRLAAIAIEAGYDVSGFDLSPAMVEMARARAPRGSFAVGSRDDVALPPCVAVAAVGEVVNYVAEPGTGAARLSSLVRRVHAALAPGGVFLFDAAEPGRGAGAAPRHWQAEDWAILVDAEEPLGSRLLTRRITTFTRAGDGFRRGREVHRLDLYPRGEVQARLAAAGLAATLRAGYGDLAVPPGLVVFEAVKPA